MVEVFNAGVKPGLERTIASCAMSVSKVGGGEIQGEYAVILRFFERNVSATHYCLYKQYHYSPNAFTIGCFTEFASDSTFYLYVLYVAYLSSYDLMLLF